MADRGEITALLDSLHRLQPRLAVKATRPDASAAAIAAPLSHAIQACRDLEQLITGSTITAEQRHVARMAIELAWQAGELATIAIHGRVKPPQPGDPTTEEELAAVADRCRWLTGTGMDPTQAALIHAERTFA